jgi:hypothetical protein
MLRTMAAAIILPKNVTSSFYYVSIRDGRIIKNPVKTGKNLEYFANNLELRNKK